MENKLSPFVIFIETRFLLQLFENTVIKLDITEITYMTPKNGYRESHT